MKLTGPKKKNGFNSETFLATLGDGRKIFSFAKKQKIFAQGDTADAVFYVQAGKVRLTVVSQAGKEATIAIVSEEIFWRGIPRRSTLAHGVGRSDDRLRDSAGR